MSGPKDPNLPSEEGTNVYIEMFVRLSACLEEVPEHLAGDAIGWVRTMSTLFDPADSKSSGYGLDGEQMRTLLKAVAVTFDNLFLVKKDP